MRAHTDRRDLTPPADERNAPRFYPGGSCTVRQNTCLYMLALLFNVYASVLPYCWTAGLLDLSFSCILATRHGKYPFWTVSTKSTRLGGNPWNMPVSDSLHRPHPLWAVFTEDTRFGRNPWNMPVAGDIHGIYLLWAESMNMPVLGSIHGTLRSWEVSTGNTRFEQQRLCLLHSALSTAVQYLLCFDFSPYNVLVRHCWSCAWLVTTWARF